jgi:predicted nucleic acid-binding protein
MNIDITNCNKVNIIDSCSLWNVLSSLIVYSVVLENKFSFSVTKFVEYECLYKPRTNPNTKDKELQNKLRSEINKGKITCHNLTIEDLQDDFILKHRNAIGIGELSSIAFAKKVSVSFLTDDKKARKIGANILGKSGVQTTPLVLGWLFFNNLLSDGDIEEIIKSHKEYNRPLEKYFREVHTESLRLKYMLKS